MPLPWLGRDPRQALSFQFRGWLDVTGPTVSGRVEVTDRGDMAPGLHDPRAESRRTEAVPGPSAAGVVPEAAGQRDAVSRVIARVKPVATSVIIPR
jgi:hypothetical protein